MGIYKNTKRKGTSSRNLKPENTRGDRGNLEKANTKRTTWTT